MREQPGDWLDQTLSHQSRNLVINGKPLVRSVSFVAGKKFVSSIPCQQRSYSTLARESSTVVRSNCRGVCKRFIKIFYDFGDGIMSIARGEAKLLMVCVEMLSGGPGETNFAIGRL